MKKVLSVFFSFVFCFNVYADEIQLTDYNYKHSLIDNDHCFTYTGGTKITSKNINNNIIVELSDKPGTYTLASNGADGGAHVYSFDFIDENGSNIKHLQYAGYVNVYRDENGGIYKYTVKGSNVTITYPDGKAEKLNYS